MQTPATTRRSPAPASSSWTCRCSGGKRPGEKSGLVYSRFNNPNFEILEDRLAIWDEAEAFAFLDKLEIMMLAVSLDGTEVPMSHRASTTHSSAPKDLREEMGLSDATIRSSVGIENPNDLITDLEQAFA